jgi:SPP1 family predicted phage head-tail adaptor
MLTAGELAAMRTTQQQTLVEACTIVRRTLVSDGAGGQTSTETSVSSLCRLAPSNNQPQDRMVAGAQQDQVLWRITLPDGTDVRAADRIDVGARSFEVKGVYGPHTAVTALVCVCVER